MNIFVYIRVGTASIVMGTSIETSTEDNIQPSSILQVFFVVKLININKHHTRNRNCSYTNLKKKTVLYDIYKIFDQFWDNR